MNDEPFGHLTHLKQFRDEEKSYQELLRTARRIVRERQFSGTFLAEDLLARDRIFGLLKKQNFKNMDETPVKWERLKALYEKPQTDDQKNLETLLLIRSFLFYAVERHDVYRTPLVGSPHAVQGFAFSKTG
ncbi:hypothetical protein A3C09_02360 [Candidatus Uhrbacteria bacterium RIFCSPHIGHO2_02_FULL_47_44]|uniref:Uncharacterized protein n=1 Tax=Candidatus Uhrbacteria bacterium RIFCSPLOWO2_02_FULL_48_18 TaxID=1802408 RepID=A0A1F7V768_9BACT|nr:MAG: hypothetical protein A2839_04200 [Candidatus Uhrbacteria bacterium RIFCSPHIGHO2_01_FULL_47_10]OGL71197.1 MAG: hypothetical protein A3C09_02360 [Candidatus Uhrbacteria bacterium RIFCSPHIGHO2_02_FULL_47_44]OGL77267.1 MAG: hypothetical protein A3E97_01200 [Candidatus Uhrbacteria bacterium RIFCSPHIGHO2_12_FULL_47_12]OGL80493.1 MAG: hypothetical protein A3B20_03745 [Candidatus Uhrbacteria bacterium RIFCSPLOWO2_01_FULL_47_17]OGL86353.1 MAG: hypothetical protein A3I41_02225 [Candidatus Uhrbact